MFTCEKLLLIGRNPLFVAYINAKDILLSNKYRELEILEHSFKIFEHVTAQKLRLFVEESIDATQRGFMPGRSTNDSNFSLRQTMEKHRRVKKSMVCLFVDLEKAFDTFPRNAVWWALRHLNVPEWLVQAIQCTYDISLSFSKLMVSLVSRLKQRQGYIKAQS